MASRLSGTNSVPNPESIDIARRILIEHELFHFLSESVCSLSELNTFEKLYKQYYNKTAALVLEEALANSTSLMKCSKILDGNTTTLLKSMMKAQGAGYSDFDLYDTASTQKNGRNALAAIILDVPTRKEVLPAWPAHIFFKNPITSSVPTKLVNDQKYSFIRVARRFPPQNGIQVHVHTNDHRPPHIHIDIPPGKAITRYAWPGLTPLPGDPTLSRSEKKRLDDYVSNYRIDIQNKIGKVYT